MNYPLIKKFLSGLVRTNIHGDLRDFVLMADLEAELAKGVEVFGDSEDIRNAAFTTSKVKGIDTHSGLLLNYKPIESNEPVSREEILELLADLSSSMSCSTATKVRLETEIKLTNEIRKRILENGVK